MALGIETNHISPEEPKYLSFSEIALPLQNVDLKYPNALFKRQQESSIDPRGIAVCAVMAGVLADRGHLVQQIGKEDLEVNVNHFEEYPLFSEEIARERNDGILGLKLSPTTTRIIAQSSSFPINAAEQRYRLGLLVDGERVGKWFLRSLNLWQRFNGEDVLDLILDDKKFPFNFQNMKRAWEKSGFQEPIYAWDNYASGKKRDLLIHIPLNDKSPIIQGF